MERWAEYSPFVPSGSKAREVRVASRQAGIGRKTSPGSWRQKVSVPKGSNECMEKRWPRLCEDPGAYQGQEKAKEKKNMSD